MTNNFKHIELVISAIQQPLRYQVRKAGTWQAINDYKDLDMRVLRNVVLDLEIPNKIEKAKLITQADLPWSELHFKERIEGMPLNPGETYKVWPYNTFKTENDPFINSNEKFSHTYMERFWPKATPIKGIRYEVGDLLDVINHLKENPLSRQAYLPIFFPEDTGAHHSKRIPCTLGYLFEIWEDKLDVTYYIRSCDIFRHFRNDIYLAFRLGQLVAETLGIRTGQLKMYIANLHLFENDVYAFTKKENKLLKDE